MVKFKGNPVILMFVAFSLSLFLWEGVSFAQDSTLRPARPVGWADEIMVMTAAGAYGVTPVTVTQMQQMYINFAWENSGGSAAQAHTAKLYIDGTLVFFVNVSAGELAAGDWMKMNTDQTWTFETSGNHTLRLDIEAGGGVAAESTYTRTINVTSDNLAHLRPNAPADWGDEVIISTQANADADAQVYVNELAYINLAFQNIGDVAAGAGTYTIKIYIEQGGNPVDTLTETPNVSVSAGAFARLRDRGYYFTSSGNYDIKLGFQAQGESQEYISGIVKTVSVDGTTVNLKPYQPTGWTAPIVVSSQSGTTTDLTPTAGQTAYIDISWVNTSETNAGTQTVSLLVDGAEVYSTTGGLNAGTHIKDVDTQYTFATAGTHTLTLTVDVNGDVAESFENDNTYVKQIEVLAAPFNLDVDGNGQAAPLEDGLLIIRYLAGFTGSSLIAGAVAADCTRCDAASIEAYISGAGLTFDADGNGLTVPLEDGLLIIRYMAGFTGSSLITGAVAANCTRCTATDIETYLLGILP